MTVSIATLYSFFICIIDSLKCALDDLGYLDVDGEDVSDEELDNLFFVLLVVILDGVHRDELLLALVGLLLNLGLQFLQLLLVLSLLLVLEGLDVTLGALLDTTQHSVLAVKCVLHHAIDFVLSLQKFLQIILHSFYAIILLMIFYINKIYKLLMDHSLKPAAFSCERGENL